MSKAQMFHEIDESTTVVRRVDPIEVYTNPDGDIVIRQFKGLCCNFGRWWLVT